MAFTLMKQLYPSPSSSGDHTDPSWAMRNVYIAATGSDWVSFSSEDEATTKAAELSGSDSSGRKYIVKDIG